MPTKNDDRTCKTRTPITVNPYPPFPPRSEVPPTTTAAIV